MKTRRTVCLVATVCCALVLDTSARTVRVASFNVLFGVGTPGSTEYDAVKAILQRVDADVVGFQELQVSDMGNWTNLAAQTGYAHTAFGENGPLSGGLRVGYFSRFPITSTFSIESPQNCPEPTVVKELTRAPHRVVIDVPDAQLPLVVWDMHHKASSGSDDRFRRAIEAIRIADNMDDYLAVNTGHVEYVVLGDMNDDVADSQTAEFNSLPSGLPLSYKLGCDIVFPVPYATFPRDAYEPAGLGMAMLAAFQEDTSDAVTRPSSGRRLDYIFVSSNLWISALGTPVAEVYNSEQDDGTGGLPKAGSPLPGGTSTDASDHFLVFADIFMADEPPPVPPRIDVVAVNSPSIRLEFETVLSNTYTVEFNDDLSDTNDWFAASDFTDVPGTGSAMIYVDDGSGTGTAPSNTVVRFYRLNEQSP